MVGKVALAYQVLHSYVLFLNFNVKLFALKAIQSRLLAIDSEVTNLLNILYHDHGDTIALQYGGSHLVNTMETYRKISPWTSHSRDVIENIKRYYNNSFTDLDKQVWYIVRVEINR